MEAVHDTQVTPARVSLVALLTVALLVFLALVSVLSWTVVFVFIAGFVLGPTFLVLAIYVGLHRAPKYIEQRTKQYVAGVALKDGHTAQEVFCLHITGLPFAPLAPLRLFLVLCDALILTSLFGFLICDDSHSRLQFYIDHHHTYPLRSAFFCL